MSGLKAASPTRRLDDVARIRSAIVAALARELGLACAAVDPERPMTVFGLDSVALTSVVGDLEQELGIRIDLSVLSDRPSIRTLSERLARTSAAAVRSGNPAAPQPPAGATDAPGEAGELRARFAQLEAAGLENPYLRTYDGIASSGIALDGRPLVNFASYNYLGLSGHADVARAATEAISRWGTSASASRLAAGQRPVHVELERELAAFLGAEDCLTFVGGHATNVSVIGHLFGARDLVVHDERMHDSAVQGAILSGARRVAFPAGDVAALDRLLIRLRPRYERTLVLIEGVYSSDGDVPDLRAFVDLKRRHAAWLMVDEAHSLGVLGRTGRGLSEHSGVVAADVELWMGTLSKALASCGGYVAGSHGIVEALRYQCGGFVFSAAMTPANAAAALAALRVARSEPARVQRLAERSRRFLERARRRELDTGPSRGAAVVPVIVGDSLVAMRVCQDLLARGINVLPLVPPAVREDAARLRFFVSAMHTHTEIDAAVDATASSMAALGGAKAPTDRSR